MSKNTTRRDFLAGAGAMRDQRVVTRFRHLQRYSHRYRNVLNRDGGR